MKHTLFLLGLLALSRISLADSLVEFHIPAGTGNKAWNTPATTVEVNVGDTLRIINDDSAPHQLHTFDRPCEHQPTESQPGEFYDCPIQTTVDPRFDVLYDHNHGASARFYLKTR